MGMSTAGTDWLEARKLDAELAARLGWTSGKDRSGKEWLSIPFVRDEKVINHKYRMLEEKRFRQDPDSEHDLLNIDCLKDHSLDELPLVITEGECDWLAVLQCGFQRVVSIPDGWSDSLDDEAGQPKFEVFRKNEQLIKSAGRIIVAQDDDATGAALLRAVTNFFDESDVQYVKYPSGCKDANDVVFHHGNDALVKVLSKAKSVDPPGGLITGFTDLPPSPPRTIWRTGNDFLDPFIALRSQGISILTGIPGAGKTTFVTFMMHRIVKEHDIRVGLGLWETASEETLAHLIALNGGGDIRGISDEELARWKSKFDRNYRLIHRVDDDKNVHGVVWASKMIHALAARDNCSVIVLDPWNELEHLPEPGETLTQYTNWALTKLRKLAEKYDIHIVLLAHPKKMPSMRPKPGAYDISDSAAWFNKPDMGWTIHTEEGGDSGPDFVSLTNWKVRSRQQTGCRPGVVKMQFDEHAMVYRQLAGY